MSMISLILSRISAVEQNSLNCGVLTCYDLKCCPDMSNEEVEDNQLATFAT